MKTIKRIYEDLIDVPTMETPFKKEINERTINAHHCAVKVGFKSGQTEMFEMSIEELNFFKQLFCQSGNAGNEKIVVNIIEGKEEFHGLDLSQIAYFKVTDWVGEDIEE